MKSIMEEASSILKAIEKGWNSAGQPKEFSIKIFEEPQKNFIGMTTKPAKIAIFFTEVVVQKRTDQQRKQKPAAQERMRPEPVAQQRKARPAKQIKEPLQKEPRFQEQPRTETVSAEIEKGPIWTDEMADTVKNWVAELLSYTDFGHLSFTVNPQHFHLKIQFQNGLFEDKNREKYFFASLSNLLLTMLKRQYKRPLKGYKIVLLAGS